MDFSLAGESLDSSFAGEGKFGDTILTALGKIMSIQPGNNSSRYDYHFRISSIDEVVSGIVEKMSFAIDDKEASVISLTYSSNVPKSRRYTRTLIDDYISYNLNQKKTRLSTVRCCLLIHVSELWLPNSTKLNLKFRDLSSVTILLISVNRQKHLSTILQPIRTN